MDEYREYWFVVPKYTPNPNEIACDVLERDCEILNACGEHVAAFNSLIQAIEVVEAHNARVRNKHGVADRIAANYRVADRLRTDRNSAA